MCRSNRSRRALGTEAPHCCLRGGLRNGHWYKRMVKSGTFGEGDARCWWVSRDRLRSWLTVRLRSVYLGEWAVAPIGARGTSEDHHLRRQRNVHSSDLGFQSWLLNLERRYIGSGGGRDPYWR